jgi:hypothetical protein
MRHGAMTYVDDSVLENNDTDSVHEDCALNGALSFWICAVFELPALSSLIKFQAWVVVSFVKILENRREDFWFFVRKIDAFCRFVKLGLAKHAEIWTVAQDVFMGGEQALLPSDTDRDDGRCDGTESKYENLDEWK